MVKRNQIVPGSVTGWDPFSDLSLLICQLPSITGEGCTQWLQFSVFLACGNLTCEDVGQQSMLFE